MCEGTKREKMRSWMVVVDVVSFAVTKNKVLDIADDEVVCRGCLRSVKLESK